MRRPDYILLILIAVFVVFGFLMLVSTSGPFAFSKFGDSYYFVKQQLLKGLLPGLFLFFLLSRLDYRLLKHYANYIFAGVIFLLLLVFIPGIGTTLGKGAKSWIGLGGFAAFQPSELAKLGLLIFLSAYLEYQNFSKRAPAAEILIKFLVILGIPVGLVLLQPDVGTSAIIVFIGLMVYFAAGAPLRYLAGFGVLSAAGLWLLMKAAPYRLARFTAFLDPSADPLGVGYHINQALLAIGSGRLFGVGLGQSRQKLQYLPEVYADSIFAIVSEEMGFFISALFVVGLGFFLWRIIKIAAAAPDAFGKYLAAGIGAWIIGQSFINIAAMLSLLPLTGVPLPFISYGGTALMTTLAACGILVNISKWR